MTTDTTARREELIRQRLAGARATARSGIPPADRTRPLPLSPGQQQMFLLNRIDPGSAEYNVPLVLRLRGELDPGLLARAWQELVARHEILRTRYELTGGEPHQVVDPPGPPDFAVVPVPGVPPPERPARATELAVEHASTPFDLTTAAPLRVRLLQFTGTEHVLVAVFHHIAFDAMSYPVVVHELAAHYDALRSGTAAPPGPEVQYADYAAWSTERLAGPAARRHLDYWREQLAGLAPLELPTDRPRPAVRDWRGGTVPMHVPAGTAQRLGALGRAADATPFMVLVSAFQALLGRYTGRRDVAVGTSTSLRNRPELEGMIGYAANSLVLRARWAAGATFRRLLAGNRDTILAGYDHRELPFVRLVEELQPERDPARTPLFQVMVDLRAEPPAITPSFAAAELVDGVSGVARFDLSVLLSPAPDGSLHGTLEYATALFDPATAQRFAGHYERLLDAVAADPDRPVSRLPFLGPDELAVVTGRAAPAPGPAGPLAGLRVDQAIERRAAASPGAVAVVAGDRRLSFAQLEARANQFAHLLRERGAGPSTRVGVLLDRGPELVAALLGVWKSGAAQVPLDPGYPAGRIGYLVADAAAELVVTETARLDLLRSAQVGDERLIVVDRDARRLDDQPVTPPPPAGGLDDLAYIIYTSGSTGRPKGVLVGHPGLANYLAWTAGAYAGAGPGGAALFSSVAFDLGLPNLYTPLMLGRPVHLLPPEFDPDDLARLLLRCGRLGFVKMTPGHLDLIAGQLGAADAAGLAGMVIAAGDSFTGRLANRWRALAGPGGTRLAAEYGPTEITVGNSGYEVTGEETGELVTIGRPIPRTTMYVLDEQLQPAPIGVPGEVCIGGIGLAWGYLNQPGPTAQRFGPDPFGPPGARLYRSGDMGRRAADGTIDFIGRADHQVKIRGYRVEPGEIEAVLTGYPQIREAVVAVRDGAGGPRLVAYLVPAPGADLDPADLRERLARSLPAYLVPSAFVPLDAIPLTRNGKVDRRALPEPDRAAAGAGGRYLPPRTVTEERIAAAWRDVLGLKEIGVEDNFFALGGDSLRAVALVGALRAGGLDLAVRDVFERGTVAGLAELVGGRPAPAPVPRAVRPFELLAGEDRARLPGAAVDAYPLSQVQAGMVWEMLADGEHRYHNVTSFRVRDERPFDPAAFRRAAQLVVDRHEVMRTSIDMTGYAVPLQVVHAAARMPVAVRDRRGLDEAEQGRVLREHTAAERAQLFDLDTPPLMRMAVHAFDDASWWLSITECHAIIEGWSYHNQLMELLRAYGRIRDGSEPEPARPAGVRFADFIAAEQEALHSPADRAYWQGVMDRYPRFTLPAAWAGPGAGRERFESFISFADLHGALRDAAAQAGVPLKSLLHAAHLKVLSMLTPAPRFFAGMVCDARPEVLDADRVSGMYLNSVPFPFDGPAATWRATAQRVFATETALWPHRRLPMPVIQRELAGGGRLIQVLFHYLDFYQVDGELLDLRASIDESPNEFPMCVGAFGTRIYLSSNTTVLGRADGERYLAMIRAVLEQMAAGLDGDARRAHLPDGAGAASAPGPAEAGIRRRGVLASILARAAEQPHAPAVVAPSGQVTAFGELAARSAQLAGHLRAAGIDREQIVGVLLDQGPDLLPSLLAVWQAGAAYLPLDPTLPDARLRLLLDDACVAAVLTDSGHAARLATLYRGPVVRPDRDAGPTPTPNPTPTPTPTPNPARPGAPVPYEPGAPAYVIYTSGSTGRPKGVVVTHDGLANYLAYATGAYLGAPGGGVVAGSIASDITVPSLYAPLLAGQPVHLGGLDGSRAAGLSFVMLTPGQLEATADQLPAERLAGLAALTVSAGEALPAGVADRWRRLTGAPIVSEYGPTEATVGAAACSPPAGAALGRPIPGMAMYVLDRWLEPVPLGALGEICLAGPGLARGYLGQPALTAQQFAPDPYGRPGSRLYRTGDLGRVRPGGSVEFVGRVDDRVKIRGYRVEPAEVTAALQADPAVRDAVVVADPPDNASARRLVAYVVPAGPGPVQPGVLRSRLAGVLPSYLVPAVVVPLDRIPLTPGGKVDRSALPRPPERPDRLPDSPDRPAFVAPRTAGERVLAGVWSSVLGVAEIGVHDTFVDLGGDSLTAIAMLAAARRAGLPLTLAMVPAPQTLAALAALAAAPPDGATPSSASCSTASTSAGTPPATQPRGGTRATSDLDR